MLGGHFVSTGRSEFEAKFRQGLDEGGLGDGFVEDCREQRAVSTRCSLTGSILVVVVGRPDHPGHLLARHHGHVDVANDDVKAWWH